MKTLLIIACACLFFVACASSVSGNGTDELLVRVALTTGKRTILPERQRDRKIKTLPDRNDYSRTKTITVERDAIVWEETISGHRLRRTAPERKEFKLSPADKRNLLKLIKSNNLLVTDSISLPYDDSRFQYFRISVALTLGRKKGAIEIGGAQTAVKVKEEKLYQNTLTLVKELYRIINTQDKDVDFAELVLEP